MRISPALLGVIAVLAVSPAGYGQEPVYRVAGDVTSPAVETEVKPRYTPAAILARVEGVVKLECVVGSDGTVRDIRIVEGLHPELDEASTRALAMWRFKPGTRDGKPVAVRIDIEMSFALRDAEPPRRGPAIDSPEVFKPGNGVTTPAVVRDVKPRYTADAIRSRVQGRVALVCVVLPDGTVGEIRVAAPLHPDLDAEAVRSLRQWTFKPGTRDGTAVPVQVEVEMTFTLRSGPPKLPVER